MSKRRQTISSITVSEKKKIKVDDVGDSTSGEEGVDTPVSQLTDKQIRECLVQYGETPGPIIPSTRMLYEKLIEKYRNNEIQPKKSSPPSKKTSPPPKKSSPPPKPCNQSTPARPTRVSLQNKVESKSSKRKAKSPVLAEDDSPEKLSPVKVESLPDPPSPKKAPPQIFTPKTKRTPNKTPTDEPPPKNCPVSKLSNKEIRDELIAMGESPGPVNNLNRKLYEELLDMYRRGDTMSSSVVARRGDTMSSSVVARRLSAVRETPVCSSTRIEEKGTAVGSNGGAAGSNRMRGKEDKKVLQDYPDEDMDVEPSLCVSYAKSPYKKTRRSICKTEFTHTDFVVLSPFSSPSSRPSFYHQLQTSGVQAMVTQDASTVALVNAVKGAKGTVKIFAGITVLSVKEARLSVSNALQCGCHAVVIKFSNYHCSDSTAISSSIKQIMEGHMTASYFYSHDSKTTACPIRISKELLAFDNGYQGIFASPDSEEKLLLLESLGIKIYETDSTKILRSLAHGIDAFASYEAIIGMPVICKLKEEYYEGNTSESCRLQLILCRLVRALTKHGDLMSALHSALSYLGRETNELPAPLQPLQNEVPLLKDLAELNVDKW